jgi:urease accessory protein
MSAAISRFEVSPAPVPASATRVPLERGDGAAEIAFARRGDGVTALAGLYQRSPCRVLFPTPAPGDLPLAALLTTSGGLAGGDRLRLEVTAHDGAQAVATTAAAEKVYRSLGADVAVSVTLTVEDGGWLEWLPQETILFEGARLDRRLVASLAPSARLLAAETLVFGRAASGERFSRGLLHEAWRIHIGGRLAWADALRLEGDIGASLDAPAAFAGARALASVLYVGADAAAHLPLARALVEESACRAGATLIGSVLLARFLDARADRVRTSLARYVAGLRAAAAGLPASLPRLWNV